jgi:Dullard-like phosphatase family protein
MLIVNNSNENELKNEKENYNYFLKCKRFLNAVNDNINEEKYTLNFQSINNIINNTLLNLLNNLTYLNNDITEDIKQILQVSKDSKINEILRTKIKQNIKVLLKVNSIIEEEEKENEIENKIKKYSTIKTDLNSLENIDITNYNNNDDESSEENLPIPEIPFLKPKDKNDKREYTLVLDLDETLVHYMEDEEEYNAYVKVRLGAENFINELSKFCEIVIFTASTEDYANTVINGLDCKNNISYKLYRQHTNFVNGFNIKDLSKLGRDISKIIIIDNIEENFSLQPDNGLNICDFEGDENDNELNFLLYDLLDVVKISGLDVREKLPEVREKMIRRYTII